MTEVSRSMQVAQQCAMAHITFMEAVLEGHASEDDVDDWMEVWHDGRGFGIDLHDFLGMTWTQYARWVRDPDVIREIVAERQRQSGS